MQTAEALINIDKISIIILIGVCAALVGLVFVLAIAYWKAKTKKNEAIRDSDQSISLGIDPLTGLPNRHGLLRKLDTLLSEAELKQSRLALLFIDLDDFKSVNDALGPNTGDILLQHVSQRILQDVGSICAMVAHLGGDEFAIVLDECGEGSKAISTVADNLINALSKPYTFLGNELLTSCSIGICIYPDCADTTEQLLKHADTARYDAKKTGRGIHVFYTKDMSEKALERKLISTDLRKALENNEFSLRYQPKIYTDTGIVQGAEALIRWHHAERGNISPAIFIPLAEESGLIHSIGEWVIRTACHDTRKLQQEGFSDLQIAINLSSFQFNKGDVAGTVAEVIWETGISPKTLELELTESVVMDNAEKSLLMLRVLKSMGLEIAIDDFGTGYSSLSQLKRFPISTLKIDQSFVYNMHKIPENVVIVSTIIQMAKQLGLKVVAEGVEVEEELKILKQHKCDIVQGYYFSKPLTFDDFEQYIKARSIKYKTKEKQIK